MESLVLPESFRFNVAQLVRDMERAMPILEQRARELAQHGWTLPGSMGTREFIEILSLGDREAIDAYFVDHYTADSGSKLDYLHAGLSQLSCLDPWRVLVDQSVEACRRGDYAITIPALLSVIEGLLAACASRGKKKVNMPQLLRSKVDSTPERSFTRAFWISIQEFTAELFRNHSFANSRPPRLNRHWILHGRDIADWDTADAFRLLQAVDTIASRCKRAV